MSEAIDIALDRPIGTVVRAWREERQLTPAQLVARAGAPITNPYLSQLENGKIRNPGDEHVIALAQALDIPVSYLVNRYLPEDVQSGKVPAQEQASPTPSRKPAVPSTLLRSGTSMQRQYILRHKLAALNNAYQELDNTLQKIKKLMEEIQALQQEAINEEES